MRGTVHFAGICHKRLTLHRESGHASNIYGTIPTDVNSGSIMNKSAEPARAILQRIADDLGVPVEQFFTGDMLSEADEYFRLWLRIKTPKGRLRALEAVRAIADEERV